MCVFVCLCVRVCECERERACECTRRRGSSVTTFSVAASRDRSDTQGYCPQCAATLILVTINILATMTVTIIVAALLQCRTATADKTPWQLSGQPVRCNLWDGLACRASEVDQPSCYNYEARLGCLKQTQQCCESLTMVFVAPLVAV